MAYIEKVSAGLTFVCNQAIVSVRSFSNKIIKNQLKPKNMLIDPFIKNGEKFGHVVIPRFQKTGQVFIDSKEFLQSLQLSIVNETDESYTVHISNNDWEVETVIATVSTSQSLFEM